MVTSEKERERKRQYRKTERYKEYIRNYIRKDVYKNRMYIVRAQVTERLRLIKLLGGKCSNEQCLVPGGCMQIRCLQIDHLNGGGRREYERIGPKQLYRYYNLHPDEAKQKLRVLCSNCNWITRKYRYCDDILEQIYKSL